MTAIQERNAYIDKLRDPRWQRRRLEILERDQWKCQCCFDEETELHVHHRRYVRGLEPWEYADVDLVTFCRKCHEYEQAHMKAAIELLASALASQGFFARQVFDLAAAIQKLHSNLPKCTPRVRADAIAWALTDEQMTKKITFEYYYALDKAIQEDRGRAFQYEVSP